MNFLIRWSISKDEWNEEQIKKLLREGLDKTIT
jgi:hypothetical protein